MNERDFMSEAIRQAECAAAEGEVPVGAVIVKNGEIIAAGRNMREKKQSVLSHAEIEAIRQAEKELGTAYLNDCEMYVTLEPCAMCAGAIINARLKRLVYGAYDHRAGAFGSLVDLSRYGFDNMPEIQCGFMEEKATSLMTNFFREIRFKLKE